jgi:flagellar biosynthetic protein FlhB
MAEGGGEDGGQEKSHEATPRRLDKAREQGDVARSQDAQSFAAYVGLAVALLLGGGWSAVTLGEALLPAIAHPDALARDLLEGQGALLGEMLLRVAAAALPAVALPAVLVVALLFAQGAIIAAPDKLAPKLSRISPVANAKQKFGVSGLVEFAKSTAKIIAVSAVLYLVVISEMPFIARSPAFPPRALGGLLMEQLEAIMIGLLVVSAAIAFLDLAWQRFEFLKRNRMTHQEIKEESKQTEGDPHMRAERRARAQEVANQRMMLDVPNADVVIINPTHYAVALEWDRRPGSAPKCLAKGVDEVALRIREVAARAGVPVHEDAATARSIHALVEIGQEIRPEHYKAVAAAILFAERMRARARAA